MRRAVALSAIAGVLVASTAHAQTAADARAVVHQARHAFDVDSTAPLADQWNRAVARDSGDRLAQLGLASLAWLTSRDTEANRRYQQLTRTTGKRPDAVNVYAELGLATVLMAEASPRAADSAYGTAANAARTVGDSTARVEALLGQAVVRAHTRSASDAAALLVGVDRLIPKGDRALAGNYQCTRAGVGDVPRGTDPKAMLRAGAALARAAGDRLVEGFCWFQLGSELERIGDLGGAIAVYDTMERQVLSPADFHVRGRIRQHRAFDEEEVGDYAAALRSSRIAIADGERSASLPVIAYARMTQGKVYLGLGDITAAVRAADSANAIFTKAGDVIGRLNALSLAGQVDLAGEDTAAARVAYNAENQLAESISALNYVADAQSWLADLAMYEHRWDEAQHWLALDDATIKRFGGRGWAATEQFSHAVLALRSGRLKEAERGLQQTAKTLDSTQHRDRYESAVLLAETHLALGDTTRAERELTAASDALDRWRATLDDREIRVLAFQYHTDIGGPDPGIAKVIAAVARTGRVGAALELAERRRARDLADHLATSGSSSPWTTSTDVLGAVQRALPDDSTAMLEYVTGPAGAPTTLFVLTRHDARAYALPPSDSLANDVSRLVAFVESGASSNAPATALSAALISPALPDLPPRVRRLVIVPDGILHRVPFAALRINNAYAVRRYAFALAPSAIVQAWLWGRATPNQAPSQRSVATVLALGDPRFAREVQSDPDIEALRSAFNETGGLPRLKGSADEAQLVARFGANSVVRLRDSASAWYLKHATLDSFRVIHLATHAVVDDRAATRTALALAPGAGESGFVTPADLAALKLHADLVMLSACRTAGGRIVAGEGVRGLTAPLFAAGARAVVASYWEIGDRQTVRLVHDFYRALAEGHPAADALRLAEVAALDRGAPPREWAAFTISGDPSVRVPVTVPRFDWWWRLFH
jgi:CHAT domain-containing protein